MHKYLRAWRLHRELTLEEVAAKMGKKHSTISRWESGKLPLKTNDLERLAKLYQATTDQVQEPPDQADLVARLREVQKIIEDLSPDSLEHWLATGRAMGQASGRKAS